ncbi:MAG: GTPase HflX [Sphaerochaetaceae bacterium]|nr:GTPase HflX [Sphaerochaetaceae bacterium]
MTIEKTFIETEPSLLRVLVLIADTGGDNEVGIERRKQEMCSLVSTMGSHVVDTVTVRLHAFVPATLIGSGKIEELRESAQQSQIDCIVFECDISPRQQRNLEQLLDLAVIDRQEVILQIFSNTARTKESTLQVALARSLYSLPRLKRRWTHLSRQQGGAKGTRGEGEKQLEIDKRIVNRNIQVIRKELNKIERQRQTQRKNRQTSPIVNAAIVGYTNAGKSSLLKALSNSDILVEDKLFATLEPVTRKVTLPGNHQILLSDTVGFVSRLPHHLVESFKSTLEEVTYSDLIIHLLDASHPDMYQCYETTREVLSSLGCEHIPTIYVINKIDSIENPFICNRLMHELPGTVGISVKDRLGLDELKNMIVRALIESYRETTLLIPYQHQKLLSTLHTQGEVISVDYQEEGAVVEAKIPPRIFDQMRIYSMT